MDNTWIIMLSAAIMIFLFPRILRLVAAMFYAFGPEPEYKKTTLKLEDFK